MQIKRPVDEESKFNVLAMIECKNKEWHESVVFKGESEPSISPDKIINTKSIDQKSFLATTFTDLATLPI